LLICAFCTALANLTISRADAFIFTVAPSFVFLLNKERRRERCGTVE
jgi:hypothetical protein